MTSGIPIAMRALLILGSVGTGAFILGRIRSSKVQIRDSIFWILFSVLLLFLSIFPGAAIWAAGLLGVESPVNFVFLFIIFILLVQLFSCNLRISQLDAKVRALTQKIALDENARDESKKEQPL